IRGEKFKEIAVTPQVDGCLNKYNLAYTHKALGILGGCLCIMLQAYALYSIEVWVMKNYNVQESWSKLFTVRLGSWIPRSRGECKVTRIQHIASDKWNMEAYVDRSLVECFGTVSVDLYGRDTYQCVIKF
ncbi:hypothetical protein C5167_044519, partial [Papaver somniferum]